MTASGHRGDMTTVLRYASFTSDPAGGNPAGVVLDARGLDDDTLLGIAADVGYSETAFLNPTDTDGQRYGLRFFSPLAEVAFCGHATVAAAVALAEHHGRSGRLVFDTPAGAVPVTTDGGRPAAATLTSVPSRSRPASEEEVTDALAALRWSREDLDPAWPPHVSFAGNDHLILGARTRERLARLDYDFDALAEVSRERGWQTTQLFWSQDEGTVHSRNPFPLGGVVEDPATGAAAAAFGGYLRAVGRVPRPRGIRIIQGEDMGRRGELLVGVGPDDPRIRVSGHAVRIPG
ncbi:phenazine biosynthesis protein PhzF family [Actinoalloteichus cyanogriseus DSM 43889]|uniref:Phenazine biosynthesis protein PhzF family n=2 Tax=Pseudonocardiaceae TaxID=2070 RepID=A0ABT1JIV0_ACTCY|nr:phenazine biosynthesis protein PhzF family [Actinoalloteichus caeruleus DSM 43889]